MWGARGPFPPAVAMVVVVVMPVVFVLWLLKINSIKKLILVACKLILHYLLYIIKHIKIHVMLILLWPEPKPLWSNGTPAYWVLQESSFHGKNN